MPGRGNQGVPEKTRKVRKLFPTLPVPQAPDAVLEAIYWLAVREIIADDFKRRGSRKRQTPHVLADRFKMPHSDVADVFRVARLFSRRRGHASHKELCDLHPHYLIWFEVYRSMCVRYARKWKDKGQCARHKADAEALPFTWKNAARMLRCTSDHLRRWFEQYEAGEFYVSRPKVIDRKLWRRIDDNRARAQFRDDEAAFVASNEARDAYSEAAEKAAAVGAGLEANAQGVIRTAADVALVPRKSLFQSEEPARVFIDGGSLVIASSFMPHDGQRAFMNSGARFRTVVAGIRGGKTRAGAVELVRHAASIPGAHGWVVGPTYTMLDNARRAVLGDTMLKERRDLLKPGGFVKRDGGGGRLHFANGSIVDFRSAEWEDTLRGPGIDFMWIDEAQLLSEDAWNICRGRTSDTGGRIWCTGTPLGRNWLYREWSKGADPVETEHASWRFPSTFNPMVSPEEVEMMRRQLPEAFFRQEYLAEFVEGVSTVFGDLDPCLVEAPPEWPEETRPRCVIGMDVARKHDFSGIVVLSSHGQVAHAERFNRVSWSWQRERVIELVREWDGAPVVVDATGVGDPFVEDLQRAGVDVTPYTMGHHAKKAQLIEQLMLDIQGARMWLPRIFERLLFELKIYRRELTAAGNVRYSAPDGEHDDMVIALALANWGARRLNLTAAPTVAAVAGEGVQEGGPRGPQDSRDWLWSRRTATVWGETAGSGGGFSRSRLFGSN